MGTHTHNWNYIILTDFVLFCLNVFFSTSKPEIISVIFLCSYIFQEISLPFDFNSKNYILYNKMKYFDAGEYLLAL